jgi:formimidoylglutamate deiminase
MPTVFVPDAVVVNGALEFGRPVPVDEAGLVMARVPADAPRVSLPGQVLLPGLVNAHSHAFQRVLRGRTEFLAKGHERDDFWSWRELMYAAAAALTPEDVFVASRQAFVEMALAGITTVGEFHYLHHQPDGQPYDDEHELARQVLRAAREVGLRIVLLRVAYARAGFEVAPNARQRRFIDPDVETCLRRTFELRASVSGLQSVGLAPHSVRAVPRGWLEQLAKHWPHVTHVHVAEQPAELTACLAEHGRRPVELLDDTGLLGPMMTGVHAIHLTPHEVELFATRGARVCACPSTERNLGDGIIPADLLMSAGVSVCLGSDSQAHIDLLDEARQLEGHLRLARLRRNVLTPTEGSLGARLLGCATAAGAQSLGLNTGTLAAGSPADFFTVSREVPSLAGLPDQALLDGLVLGAPSAAIREVVVQGKRLVHEGQHPLAAESAVAFTALMRRLAS